MQTKTIIELSLISFIPIVLHIWLYYVWFWRLLALLVASKAIQQCNRQAPAVSMVCILTGPAHIAG